MKIVKFFLLIIFLCAINYNTTAQNKNTLTDIDSIISLLDYFHSKTNNPVLITALQKAKSLCNNIIDDDTLAANLLKVEEMLVSLKNDSSQLNRHPFEKEKLHNYGRLLVEQFKNATTKNEKLNYAAAMQNLGAFYDYDNLAKAINLFSEAMKIRKNILGENSALYAESLSSYILASVTDSNFVQSKSMLLKALAIIKNTLGDSNNLYAENLFSLANLCRGMKLYDTSEILYGQVINIKEKLLGKETPAFALSLYYTGEMVTYNWQFQKALRYYQRAEEITRQSIGEENILYAYCLDGIAGYYYNIADYKNAIPLYNQSLEIKEKLYGKDYYDNALTLHNLATTYFKLGNYEKAIPCLQQVFLIHKKDVRFPGNHAYELNWMGSLYQNIGNYSKALEYYKQSIEIPEYKKSPQRYATTLSNMASVYEKSGQDMQALSYLKQALIITRNFSGERSLAYSNILYDLAAYNEKHKNFTSAIQLCFQSIEILKKIYDDAHPAYASALMLLAKTYRQVKKYDSAEIYLTLAIRLQKNILGTLHPDYINSLTEMGLLKTAQHQYDVAASCFANANILNLKYTSRTYSSLSEQEKLEFEKHQYLAFSYLPSIIFKHNLKQPRLLQQLYNNELILKGMVLFDQQSLLKSIRKSNSATALELYDEWRINKILLGKQLLLPKDERVLNLDSLEDLTNRLEQQLSSVSTGFRQEQQVINMNDIAAKLLPGEAAVEFFKFQLYNTEWTDSILYAAVIIRAGDTIPIYVPLFEEQQLMGILSKQGKNENALNRFYSFNDANNKGTGTALYKLIWQPLEKYLDGVNTVYYSPEGLLHRIAFQALPVNSSEMLINKYHLQQMLSTRAVITHDTSNKKFSLIDLWGNIAYNNQETLTQEVGNKNAIESNAGTGTSYPRIQSSMHQWADLPGTEFEIDTIKKLFDNSGIPLIVTTGTVASEKTFKALDEVSAPLLHIATHGFFWPANRKLNNKFTATQNPMFCSGLVLAGANNIYAKDNDDTSEDDGILTAYEIAQIDLSNTDLVVLSACETALGDLQNNEGVIGLQRAFKLAGVKQLILSLWRVPDEQTAMLMSFFYRNILQGMTAADALRNAQLEMKKKYPPFDWAGFVLIQ